MGTELSPEEIARSHRWHAVECNNLAWRLSDQTERTPIQDQELLNAAHASAYHWSVVGEEIHQARAKMLLAHAHAALGSGPAALEYARQSHDYISSHESPDWELAFSHAVFAHAAFAAGEADLHRQHYAKAAEFGQAIADAEDKEIFLSTFERIPRP